MNNSNVKNSLKIMNTHIFVLAPLKIQTNIKSSVILDMAFINCCILSNFIGYLASKVSQTIASIVWIGMENVS